MNGMTLAGAERFRDERRLLPFRMHDFCRRTWVSDAARKEWEPRIGRIGRAWAEIERESVAAGVRSAALLSVPPDQLVSLARWSAQRDLAAIPLERQGVGSSSYRTGSQKPQPGGKWDYRVVLCRSSMVKNALQLLTDGGSRGYGSLLGYPACCMDFFEAVWTRQQRVDTTWAMAGNTAGVKAEGNTLRVQGPPISNILLRWIGVRPVPHLPCSFACEATADFGNRLIAVGHELGFKDEMSWLLEMLGFPIEWSALHGIAELRTPLFKVATNTDATAEKYAVQYSGHAYPRLGAKGLMFPYDARVGFPATDSRNGAAKASPDTEGASRKAAESWRFRDNGFVAQAAMECAHAPIVSSAREALAGAEGRVLDLGCGNGRLLREICGGTGGRLLPYGIDTQETVIDHARRLWPNLEANHFVVGDIFDESVPELWSQGTVYELVLLMPGRLIEAKGDREACERLVRMIRTHAKRLLVYAYEDWLSKHGPLARIAEQVGLAFSFVEILPSVMIADVRADERVL